MCSSAKIYPVIVFMAILEIEIASFACLLNSEGGTIAFPKYFDVALSVNKTNEVAKKQ